MYRSPGTRSVRHNTVRLNVLCTPPAFILSQDQTLYCFYYLQPHLYGRTQFVPTAGCCNLRVDSVKLFPLPPSQKGVPSADGAGSLALFSFSFLNTCVKLPVRNLFRRKLALRVFLTCDSSPVFLHLSVCFHLYLNSFFGSLFGFQGSPLPSCSLVGSVSPESLCPLSLPTSLDPSSISPNPSTDSFSIVS